MLLSHVKTRSSTKKFTKTLLKILREKGSGLSCFISKMCFQFLCIQIQTCSVSKTWYENAFSLLNQSSETL